MKYENWLKKTIKNKQEKQALTRRRRSVAIMKDYAGQYDCKECIHGKTNNCADPLPNGCEHYHNAASGREFQANEGESSISARQHWQLRYG